LLHHVEALVRAERRIPLDPLARFILRALTSIPLSLADLESRLHVGSQLLRRVLGELATADLVQVDGAEQWSITAAGRTATDEGEAFQAGYERRAFHFRDTSPTRFVPLEVSPCQPVTPPPGWSFDPAVLRQSADQSVEWKHRHGFPSDVRALLTLDDPEGPPPWQRIIVDRAEHVVLALTVVSGAEPQGELRGFSVESRGWLLNSARPALTMGAAWREVFPELVQGPSDEAWRGAWRAWCQAHAVSLVESDACALKQEGATLRVEGPRELLGRLHSGNGESARDEVWLLAGEGVMRTAARLVLVPAAA
jgi:hypothetical protein